MTNVTTSTDPSTSFLVAPTGGTAAPGPQDSIDVAHDAPSQRNSSQETQSGPARLIDWLTLRPDGSQRAMQAMLDHLSTSLQAQTFLGLRSDGSRQPSVFTPSKAVRLDSRQHQLLKSSLTEATQAKSACLVASEHGSSSGVLNSLLKSTEAVLWLSFAVETSSKNTDLESSLALRVSRADQLCTRESYAARIEQIRQELPIWLQQWQLAHLGRNVQTWHRRLAAWRGNRGKLAVLCALAIVLCMAIPVPYRPQRECIVEPAARSYISSPIEGNLSIASVRPGDVVSQGQVLARIDDKQIQWDLSSAKAEYEAAKKRRDSALASRSGGELRLAQLEQERIELRLESLNSQLNKLEVRSPIDGIVVQGDWFQNEGAPIDRGETLFEISPLDTMQIETRLTTEDLGSILPGTEVVAHFDAAHSLQWTGTLERIDPRGQVIDSKVIFVADVQVPNTEFSLRPGMKGSARLVAGNRSLGWLLFHRPYVWIMKKLVW